MTGTLDFIWQSPLFSWTQALSAIAKREENAGTSSSTLSTCSSGQAGETLKCQDPSSVGLLCTSGIV